MNFGVRWDHVCIDELEEIYGDHETADAAVKSITWHLARNPLHKTWTLAPHSEIRLAWVQPYLNCPAVYLSFEIQSHPPNGVVLVKRARRANDPALS